MKCPTLIFPLEVSHSATVYYTDDTVGTQPPICLRHAARQIVPRLASREGPTLPDFILTDALQKGIRKKGFREALKSYPIWVKAAV